ncbi:polysaccharide deacetylase family protein [Thalassomonas viridans]|uniref:Polysaccharide deacetylase family protein n=1 Tax=Thalassomonas viridans TaxID=137584 RepID=A0AAE9Z4A4_9GAMM|nr:polysaccharide deacetylase family protein [Thalassomonas viridans]WDE06476.1 polysaccharide deacetylase family protein [Thalassomonas viridans]
MKSCLMVLVLLLAAPLSLAKEIAITFDDSPRKAAGYFSGPERAQKLIAELKQHKVPQVAFFSNSSKLDEEGVKRLQAYSRAGHVIANHSHDHADFNRTGLEQYVEAFLLADEKLGQFENFKKLYRFPYLREGNDKAKRDGMRAALKKHGYSNAYITLNNYDWHIESLFQAAIDKKLAPDFERMGQFYVQVLMESIEYYDQMAQTHLGRSPRHVLLLHEMDISALFIGDLVDELKRKGWRIITPERAYQDEIAQYQTERVLPFNPGRIGEIARDKGQKKGLWHSTLDENYLEQRFISEVLQADMKTLL